MWRQENKRLFISKTQKPKYAQIQNSILKAIQDGIWEADDKIPSELKLAELHQASLFLNMTGPFFRFGTSRFCQVLSANGFVCRI